MSKPWTVNYSLIALISFCMIQSCGDRRSENLLFILLSPDQMNAETISSSEILLTWTDNSDNEDGFKIERARGTDDFAEIRTLPSGTVSLLDEGLAVQTTYKYRVRAYNGNNYSGFSNVAQATTLPSGTMPFCVSGQRIVNTCICGGNHYSGGYCCNGTHQLVPCEQEIVTENGHARVNVNLFIRGKDKLHTEDGKLKIYQLADNPPLNPTCQGCVPVTVSRYIDGAYWDVPQPVWTIVMNGNISNEHDMQLTGLVTGAAQGISDLQIEHKNCRKLENGACIVCAQGSSGCFCTEINIVNSKEILIDDSLVCSGNNIRFNYRYDFTQVVGWNW